MEDSLNYLVLGIAFFLLECLVRVDGLHCLDCQFLSRPTDCHVVRDCNQGEECYIEKYVTGGSSIFYDLGCESRQVCADIQHPFGRRSTTVTCKECCNSTDLCNVGGQCGTHVPSSPPSGSKYCYECPHDTINPEDCRRISTCGTGSMCFIGQSADSQGKLIWKHSCKSNQECQTLANSGNYTCSSCCDTNFCNNQCTPKDTTTAQNIATTTSATQIVGSKPTVVNITVVPSVVGYGQNIRVVCTSDGQPNPLYAFIFKGGALESNIIEIQNILLIQNYSKINDGEYVCVAKNSYGSLVKQFTLHG